MLTILMPTQNRVSFLRRAITFYENENLPFRIVLADSSAPEMKGEVARIVETSSLKIRLINYPFGFSPFKKFEDALSSIDTEYVVMIADDDFIFPDALIGCVEFLKRNSDFAAARAEAICSLSHTWRLWFGQFREVSPREFVAAAQ